MKIVLRVLWGPLGYPQKGLVSSKHSFHEMDGTHLADNEEHRGATVEVEQIHSLDPVGHDPTPCRAYNRQKTGVSNHYMMQPPVVNRQKTQQQ